MSMMRAVRLHRRGLVNEELDVPRPQAAWQELFVHGELRGDGRVRVLGATGGVGHLAVQLSGRQLADADMPCDLIFDTVRGTALVEAVETGARVVSVAEEADGAVYFVVEPNRKRLAELASRADTGELKPAIDSVFTLADAAAAFERVAERGKHGKVVLDIGDPRD
jgi:NADPH:quinone reductase-like Zn-dependent oxidoreductase